MVFENKLQTLALTRFPVSKRDVTSSIGCTDGRTLASYLDTQADDKSRDGRAEVSGRESR